MINFDKYGNPQPSGIRKIPMEEFKTVFVKGFPNSESRIPIFKDFENYNRDFKNQIYDKFVQWLNGSFTTSKENPNDIDLVNLVEYSDELNKKYSLLKDFLTVGGSKDKYLVDGYFVPIYKKDDPRYKATEEQLSYWADWFGHDREKRPKTLFEVNHK
jgi:hypothetical protein